MINIQKIGLTLKKNELYKVVGLEGESKNLDLEIVIYPKEKFFQDRPQNRDIIDEERQYRIETLTERLLAVWHTPQQVIEYYLQKHRKGETTQQLFSSLKRSQKETYQAFQNANQTIIDISEDVESAQENIKKAEEVVVEIRQIGDGRTFYNQNGITVNERDLENIFREYFRGTDLENVSYQWSEIANPSYLSHAASFFWVEEGNPLNTNLNRINAFAGLINQLKTSYDSATDTNKKKAEKALKETKLRSWILEEVVKNNNLKSSISSDPKLIALSYKIEVGEEARLIYVATHSFNNRFGVNWSPLTVFSFLTTGLFGIVFLGYWFLARVKALVRNRNTNNQQSMHKD